MAIVYKTLGQSTPSVDTLTTIYTAPAATAAICSTLAVCNQGAVATFRVAVRPAGAVLATEHYIVYDSPINPNESIFLTLGVTLAETDVMSIYANTNTLSFSLFGSEMS